MNIASFAGGRSIIMNGGSSYANGVKIKMEDNTVNVTWKDGKKSSYPTQTQYAEYDHKTGNLFIDKKLVSDLDTSSSAVVTNSAAAELETDSTDPIDPTNPTNPTDSKSLHALLDKVDLHSRSDIVCEHIGLFMETDLHSLVDKCQLHSRSDVVKSAAEHFGNTASNSNVWISSLESCELHSRSDVVHALIRSIPILMNSLSAKQWTTILELVELYSRADTFCDIIKQLPNCSINESHIDSCELHSRGEVVKVFYKQQLEKAKSVKKEGKKQDQKEVSQKQPFSDLDLALALSLSENQPVINKDKVVIKIVKSAASQTLEVIIKNPSKITESPKSSGEDDQCVICLDGRKRHVMCLPCAHTPACLTCVKTLKEHKCPMCQKAVTEWIVSN
ncbi:MAG: hypothetical protein Solumvirus6_20 [Solumvirus sp.]|uniref:RING-type domain-containing protein n=1 Tax=Solumvirus sp. TaxID=2487773 RepID=A0A3G5AGP6_9VIRU|nr:MAG: hypothetical protein Solumvirus6_20 [Solumvirus sp.]